MRFPPTIEHEKIYSRPVIDCYWEQWKCLWVLNIECWFVKIGQRWLSVGLKGLCTNIIGWCRRLSFCIKKSTSHQNIVLFPGTEISAIGSIEASSLSQPRSENEFSSLGGGNLYVSSFPLLVPGLRSFLVLNLSWPFLPGLGARLRLHGTFGKSFPVEMLFEFNLKDDITDVISEKMLSSFSWTTCNGWW